MSYSAFARYYDILTGNVEYKKRADYFDRIIKKYSDKEKGVLLDLACGTGTLSEEMSLIGYDVIGADNSPEMLNIAFEKKIEKNLSVQYIMQDMRELDLFGTVDYTVCALDSLNHLPEIDDIKKVFRGVSEFSEKNGIFIFDMNTIYKHREILGSNTFIYDLDEVYCVWDNVYCEEKSRVDITLDFFEKKDDDTYIRSGEEFSEYAYSPEAVAGALEEAGFSLEAMFKDGTFENPDEQTERIVYTARKVK